MNGKKLAGWVLACTALIGLVSATAEAVQGCGVVLRLFPSDGVLDSIGVGCQKVGQLGSVGSFSAETEGATKTIGASLDCCATQFNLRAIVFGVNDAGRTVCQATASSGQPASTTCPAETIAWHATLEYLD